jgi:hypothetical protein
VVTIYTAQWSLYVPQSGHYMYRQFNIHQLYVLPTQLYLCFVWISEQTAIISLYNINWLVCITQTQSVYCAVRTGCLNVQFSLTIILKVSAIRRAMSSPFKIMWWNQAWTRFYREYLWLAAWCKTSYKHCRPSADQANFLLFSLPWSHNPVINPYPGLL